MVVKRQKSNSDINGKEVVTIGGGKGANGALIQAVCLNALTESLR